MYFSVMTLESANVSHMDIKPSNYLIDWPEGEEPNANNITVYLSDFGMVDKRGGYTPLFGSPGIISEFTEICAYHCGS